MITNQRVELDLAWKDGGEKFKGKTIFVAHTTERPDVAACRFCAAGTCVQRIERCDAWKCDLVIHDERAELADG